MQSNSVSKHTNVPEPPGIIRTGTAGWSIPRFCVDSFPAGASLLARYSSVFNCVEINSSFYRPHRRSTYERWAATTPEGFLFSVKMPKEITHVLKLRAASEPLARFAEEVGGLGQKLGPILVQVPPSVPFDSEISNDFFALLRTQFSGAVVCEPRHPSWFEPTGLEVMRAYAIDPVLADPSPCPAAGIFSAKLISLYYRLHGSPRMYYSRYPETTLSELTASLADGNAWCIFDNTAAGAAIVDALRLKELLGDHHQQNDLR
jgi:uncharacterized protein YecE (DUF72 family)